MTAVIFGVTVHLEYVALFLAVWLIGGTLFWMGVYVATSRKSGG